MGTPMASQSIDGPRENPDKHTDPLPLRLKEHKEDRPVACEAQK